MQKLWAVQWVWPMYYEIWTNMLQAPPIPRCPDKRGFTVMSIWPVPWKFMVGMIGHFTLQSMTRTNHKFPSYGGRGIRKEAKSTV